MNPFGHRWAICTKVEDGHLHAVARRTRQLFFREASR
jgi:PhnB protein